MKPQITPNTAYLNNTRFIKYAAISSELTHSLARLNEPLNGAQN